VKNAEAKVCRAAGPRWEARWGPGGRRSVRCALREVPHHLERLLESCIFQSFDCDPQKFLETKSQPLILRYPFPTDVRGESFFF